MRLFDKPLGQGYMRNFLNRLLGSSIVDTKILSSKWSSTLPNSTRYSETWPCAVIPSMIRHYIHQLVTLLPNWTFLLSLSFLPNWLVVGWLYWGFTSLHWYFSHIATWKQEITNLWKFKCRGRESNLGPLAPQAKSLTTRPPLLPLTKLREV